MNADGRGFPPAAGTTDGKECSGGEEAEGTEGQETRHPRRLKLLPYGLPPS
jgi:hypothetical protein